MLDKHGINIAYCRFQSYDNANNMSGIYSGVQARFKQVNTLATWVPCAAHSLNLVETISAECCLEAAKFFGILQLLFTFFAVSSQRWSRLISMGNKFSLKSLSDTRWSSCYDAVRTLKRNYNAIFGTLVDITECKKQK